MELSSSNVRSAEALPPLTREDLGHVLTHTRACWEELRGKTLFLTGGTGFVGHWLLETFAHANDELRLGARVTVLSRNPAAFARKSPHLAARADLRWLTGDVRNFAFPSGEFSHVIHAGTTSGAPVEPLEMFDTVVQGTRRALEFAAAAGTRKFLFVSSGAVYGRQPPEMTHIAEDYTGAPNPLDPASAYGEGKRAAEHLCMLMSRQHGFEVKIARGFTFVGPHLPLDQHFAIGNFIRDALAGGPIQVHGDGTPFRSYLYAADLAVWLWTILTNGASGRAYNVGSDGALSIAELADLVSAKLGGGCPVRIAQVAKLGQASARYVPSVIRARDELALRPLVQLPEALHRLWQWQVSHDSRWGTAQNFLIGEGKS